MEKDVQRVTGWDRCLQGPASTGGRGQRGSVGRAGILSQGGLGGVSTGVREAEEVTQALLTWWGDRGRVSRQCCPQGWG